jgi:pimeloyl-ACP methyl ester carboxylesterase
MGTGTCQVEELTVDKSADIEMPGVDRRLALTSIAGSIAALAFSPGEGPAQALEAPATGVVLLHGKWFNTTDVQPVAQPLRDAGFRVDTPEMPWSGRRLYDQSCTEVYDEIESAVERLVRAGAHRIVVGGHSSGAAAALRYASLGKPVAALVLIAPAPVIESQRFQGRITEDLARARTLAAMGAGDTPTSFHDFNSIGQSRAVTTTPNIYLSFNAPEGPAAMTRAAPLMGPAPILWVAPSDDPGVEAFEQFVRPKLPASARLERVDIIADHLGALAPAADPVRNWLLKLA